MIGILLGYFKPDLGQAMQPLGDGFIKLVKMIIAPVIFLTVATGIAAMSDLKKVGRVAGKAMLYFLVFSTLALIVGMVVSHIVPVSYTHLNISVARGKEINRDSESSGERNRKSLYVLACKIVERNGKSGRSR